MDTHRRQLLLGLGGAAVLGGIASCGRSTEQQNVQADTPSFEAANGSVALPGLPSEPLLNRSRASQIMVEQGIEALVCARPENIYYLTNYYPQLSKLGIPQLSYAILPRDVNVAPILVVGQFAYSLGGADLATPNFVDVRIYTAPVEADNYYQSLSIFSQLDAPAYENILPNVNTEHPLHPIERNRRQMTLDVSKMVSPTAEIALLKGIRDLVLKGKRVAVDVGHVKDMLERAEGLEVVASGENLIRSVRLQKSPAEIAIARYAARANAEAALAAAKTVRDGASFLDLRTQYALGCAERSLETKFMVIDGVIKDEVVGEIEEGRSFLIDCVSHHQNYHGDYGRTVCVGEPTRQIKRSMDALSKVWDELLPQLNPGLRYSEISAMATQSFSQQNSDAGLIFNPHSVGLHHTDEPSRADSYRWAKDDLVLLEGMVLSVDLPMAESGLGGSGHLEDLVLIGAEGAELLNDTGDRVIVV